MVVVAAEVVVMAVYSVIESVFEVILEEATAAIALECFLLEACLHSAWLTLGTSSLSLQATPSTFHSNFSAL